MIEELIRRTRSVRGYDESRKITEEELHELIALTTMMPSSRNKQALKFRPVWKEEELAKVQPLTGWAKNLSDITLPHEGMCPTAFIVICQDTAIDDSKARYQRDVGITAYGMLLAAVEKGLSGCMLGTYQRGPLIEALQLPENLEPQLVVAFGKQAESIVLTELPEDGSTSYYRDDNDVHYVPKRKPDDVIIR